MDNTLQRIHDGTAQIMDTLTRRAAANKESQWVCPCLRADGTGVCGHGASGDGIRFDPSSKNPYTLHCFSCNFSGDIIDLLRNVNGGPDAVSFLEAKKEAMKILGIPDEYKREYNAPGNRIARQAHATQAVEPASKATDQTEYYKLCNSKLNSSDSPEACSYLADRGITAETARKYGLGYDREADPAKTGHPCPRIIVPFTKTGYMGRSIDPNTPKQYAKMNNKGGEIGLFNEAALYGNAQTVFLVEGVFDALSVIENGEEAVSLNSTSNAKLLIRRLEQRRTKATVVVCLDMDNAGQNGAKTVVDGLKRLNISYTTADICTGHKDPNEAWADPGKYEDFTTAVKEAVRMTVRPDNTSLYIDRFMGKEIEDLRNEGTIPTGYENLDRKIGGLHVGLYVIAANSSLGKTTFMHQMADQIAASGKDVLFFSLEQSRLELVSKSIARIMAQRDMNEALDSLQIRMGAKNLYTQEAIEQYKSMVSDRISIIEGNFSCTASFIGDYVRGYIERYGVHPVVIVDYLQILQEEEEDRKSRKSSKDRVEATVTNLKRLSREQNVPVFLISSVNRSGYLVPVDFESLKETGGIEFTADSVWGLQLFCIHEPVFSQKDKDTQKRKRVHQAENETPRQIELVCLKNRYGVKNFKAWFNYYQEHDLFVPSKRPDTTNE